MNLATRLAQLERQSSAKFGAGPAIEYRHGAPAHEVEQLRADAVAEWETRHGRKLPANATLLHIVIRGVKPGEAQHAL